MKLPFTYNTIHTVECNMFQRLGILADSRFISWHLNHINNYYLENDTIRLGKTAPIHYSSYFDEVLSTDELTQDKGHNITGVLINGLKSGKYPVLKCDMAYWTRSPLISPNSEIHEILIYGYENGYFIFPFLNSTKTKWSECYISEEDLSKGFYSASESLFGRTNSSYVTLFRDNMSLLCFLAINKEYSKRMFSFSRLIEDMLVRISDEQSTGANVRFFGISVFDGLKLMFSSADLNKDLFLKNLKLVLEVEKSLCWKIGKTIKKDTLIETLQQYVHELENLLLSSILYFSRPNMELYNFIDQKLCSIKKSARQCNSFILTELYTSLHSIVTEDIL